MRHCLGVYDPECFCHHRNIFSCAMDACCKTIHVMQMSRVENFEENNQDDSGHKSLPQVHWSAVYLEQLRVATVYYVYPFM